VSWFSRIEQACASFIERAFARTFPSDLEPAQIARKLVTTMGANARSLDGGGQSVPGEYVVRMHPEDYARLQRHREYLLKEWMQVLGDTAHRVNSSFEEPLEIRMCADETLPVGAVEIDCAQPLLEERHAEAPAETNRFRLRIVGEMPAGAVYALDGALHVGRGDEADVQLLDPAVSRSHAVIDVDDGHATVRDLGSTNGTYVNGKRVATATLMPGDVVTLGKTNLRVEQAG
jgi:hypothetical protein